MKVMITGAQGQLGRALIATAPVGTDMHAADRAALDIGDEAAVAAMVAAISPALIINAAAYTAVDRAESEEALATRINGDAVGYLATAARNCDAKLVHISTDFVFDGSASTPYPPHAPTAPLGAYGRSKLAGELAAGPDALVIRTGWVYSAHGSNFARTMLRLFAEREEVRVVADQVGTPTHAKGLAEAIWALSAAGHKGIFHYSDAGVASWYDFALAIQEEALWQGVLTRTVPVIPIATADYPTPARRPAYSVLDKSATWVALGGPAPHWRVALRAMIRELKANG